MIRTDAEAKAIARTMLRQIGNLRLSALNVNGLTFEALPNGDVTVAFLLGKGATNKIRKATVTYNSGPDTYTVASFTMKLGWTEKGTALLPTETYSLDGVYAEQLGEVVVAAARAAGSRPRL